MQHVVCFACKTELRVPNKLMSRRITCLRCGERLTTIRGEAPGSEPQGHWQVVAITAVTAVVIAITWLILATRPAVLGTVATGVLIGLGFLIYIAPSVIAFVRQHHNRAA